jgi:hypothetical protein
LRLTMLRTGTVAVAITAALVSAGCTQDSQASAEAVLCDSLATFGESLEAFAALDPATASIEDIRAARTTMRNAWDLVVVDAAAVTAADEGALEDAWTGLSDAVDDIPTDQPAAEALDTLEPAKDAVQSAYDEMANGLACG